YWGPNLVRNLVELSKSSVAFVCDTREERLAAIGRRYPGITGVQSFDSVLEDNAVEAVALATPVSTHHGLASAALEAGKHVFVEKALSASQAEAVELSELSGCKGPVLMPCQTLRYSPPVNPI